MTELAGKICAMQQVVTPYEVTGGADGKVDYDRLVTQVTYNASQDFSVWWHCNLAVDHYLVL